MKYVLAGLALLIAVKLMAYRAPEPAAAAAPRASAAVEFAPPLHEQLRRVGGWLVDRQGRVVILHGVNAVWKRAPYTPPDSLAGFTAADADWLAANGFNAVRLGVLFAGVMPQPQVIDHEYLRRVDRVVGLLAARGIYVMLDFHQDLYGNAYAGEGFPQWAVRPARRDEGWRAGFPIGYLTPRVGRAFDALWENGADLQGAYREAWTAVAAHWRDSDHLMGYDLMNEPWSGGYWPSCARPGGCPAFETGKLQAMYERVLAGIRAVDPANIVWLEPQVLFEFGADSHLGVRRIADAQLGLSWHNYCLAETLMQSYGVKDSATCARLEQRVFRNAGAVAGRLAAASMLSEFGASDDAADIARVVASADRQQVGWMYWSYKNWGDPTTQAQGSGAQSLFRSDRDLGSVKLGKLAALERPYPQAVAGTPLGFDFDPQTRQFSLRYATTLASGRRAAADTVTEIFVPALHYPRGYSVAVRGGRVLSGADAGLLRILADPDATNVEVRVGEPALLSARQP